MLTLIGSAIAVLFLRDALRTKAAGDKLIMDIDKVVWKGIKNFSINIDIVFKCSNPTGKKLTFNYLFLDIYLDDKAIAKIREENMNLSIPASGSSKLPVSISVPLTSLGSAALNIISTGKIPNKALIKGNLKVNDYTSEYNAEYPLTFS